MKPSNLLFKVLNPAATKDEDSIDAHIESSVCGFCFLQAFRHQCKEKGTKNGKKIIYL